MSTFGAMPCKGCILLVDDDPDIRSVLSDCFEDLGCTVVTAADGRDAVGRLDGGTRPCLVLLDLDMPRAGGSEVAAFIREHPAHRELPIVSMSAGTDQLTPPLVLCHRCKPFDFAEMVPLVERFCQDPGWLHGAR